MSLSLEADRRLAEIPQVRHLPQEWREAVYLKDGRHFAVALRLPQDQRLEELSGRELLGEIELSQASSLSICPSLTIPVHTTLRSESIREALAGLDQTMDVEKLLETLTTVPGGLPILDIMALHNQTPLGQINFLLNLCRARDLTHLCSVCSATIAGKDRMVRLDILKPLDVDKPPTIPAFTERIARLGITITPIAQELFAKKIQQIIG